MKLRIVIDTNVFVISLIGKGSPKLTEWLSDMQFTVLFSKEAISELTDVITRPKFKKLFTTDRVYLLLDLLENVREIIEIKSNTNICRDGKDNFLLNLAKDGNADYLITEDLDLLELGTHYKTKIVKYQQFVSLVINRK